MCSLTEENLHSLHLSDEIFFITRIVPRPVSATGHFFLFNIPITNWLVRGNEAADGMNSEELISVVALAQFAALRAQVWCLIPP